MQSTLKKDLPKVLNLKNFNILTVFSKTLPAVKSNFSDEDLLLLYKKGEKQAFDTLLSRHHRPLYNFVFKYLGNHQAAEEAFQEIFLRIIRAVGTYQPSAKFTTWLYTIARNYLIDTSRKEKFRKHASLSQPIGDDDETIESQVSDNQTLPDQIAGGRELEGTLIKILDSLAPEQKEVFLLRETQGLQFDEIAKVTKVSTNTVKSRMRYALKAIQQRFVELGFDLNDDVGA